MVEFQSTSFCSVETIISIELAQTGIPLMKCPVNKYDFNHKFILHKSARWHSRHFSSVRTENRAGPEFWEFAGVMTESQGLFQGINEKKVFGVNGIKWGVPKYFAWTLVSRVHEGFITDFSIESFP